MTQKTQTKQIPKGWKTEKLENLGKWGSGGTPLSSIKDYYGGNIKWAIIGDLNESVLYDTKTKITLNGLENSSAKLVPKNTLLIGMYGSIGKTAITGCELATNQAIAFCISNKEIIDLYFLKYFINMSVGNLFGLSKGGTQKNISQEVLKKFTIPLPPLPVQTLIVQEIEKQFTRLDEAVKSLKSVKQKLEVYRKAVLKKAFEKKEGWEEKKVKEVSELIEYGTSKKAELKGEIPVLRMGNLQGGRILFHNLKFYNSLKEIEHLLLKRGDLLFNRTNSYELVGKTSIFKESSFEKVTFASYLIRIRVDNKKVLPEFLNYFLNSPYAEILKKDLKSQQVGQANINGTKLKNIEFPIPLIQEQQSIVQSTESKFSVIDKIEQVVEESLKKSEKLRKSILKSAFEGKLIKIEHL
ncbi:restriction endonuclease subunit S [Candidatus Pacearchaeota archaeon]|nr:restriction endonuclease subunit S [Candidatus Pacearchaeota archaeon]